MKRLFQPNEVKQLAAELGQEQGMSGVLRAQLSALLVDYLDIVSNTPEPAEAWESGIDAAYDHYLTEEERDHLLALNPHTEGGAVETDHAAQH